MDYDVFTLNRTPSSNKAGAEPWPHDLTETKFLHEAKVLWSDTYLSWLFLERSLLGRTATRTTVSIINETMIQI